MNIKILKTIYINNNLDCYNKRDLKNSKIIILWGKKECPP